MTLTEWDQPHTTDSERRSSWSVAAVGALAGAVLFVVARNALPDDSYITFSYVRNLAEHGQWALTEGIPANTATSPLNVWLLTALTAVVGTPVIATALLLTVATAVTALWLHSIARENGSHRVVVAVLGVGVLVTSPLLSSTVGLETYLVVALIVGLTRYALFGRWPVAGLLAGLLVLARPDLVTAAVAIVLVAGIYRRQVLRPAAALVLGGMVVAPWALFLWVRFGSATSDTLPAKSVAGGWDGYTMVNGLGHYVERWTLATSLTLLPVAIGAIALVILLFAAVNRRRLTAVTAPAVAIGLAGVVDYLALSALQVAPFFWYYAPLVAGISLCGVLAAAAVLRSYRRAGGVAVGVVVGAVALAGGYDVLRGAPWDGMAPIRINWATPAEYRAIAYALPSDAVVESPGEIGTLAYFCDCTLVDYLADPGRMVPYIQQYRARRPDSMLLALNYLHYEPPAPVPASWRLVYEWEPPTGINDWPATFPGDRTKRMRLQPQ